MTQANRVTANPDPVVAAYIGKCGRDTGISYQDFKRLYDLFNETIREVGRKKGVLVIDLAREVPPDKEHLYDLVHFNEAGLQVHRGGSSGAVATPVVLKKWAGSRRGI